MNRSDVWAFACIFFYFLAGRLPFKEPTDCLIFQKIQKGEYSELDDEDMSDASTHSLVLLEHEGGVAASASLCALAAATHVGKNKHYRNRRRAGRGQNNLTYCEEAC